MRMQFWIPCLALLMVMLPVVGAAEDLDVRVDGIQLRVAAPSFHFIVGDALKRLRDGATVSFVFQVGISMARFGSPQDLVTTRFAVSYDLWEEKYAVRRAGLDGVEARTISNLSLAGAEKWCLDSLALPTMGLAPDRQFWVTLGYRTEELRPAEAEDNSPLTLNGMIEIFSQRTDRQRSAGKKEITGGPYRLSDLRRNR